MNERDLALAPSDRGVIIGKAGCGKSTLATRLIGWWQQDYCHPQVDPKKRGRVLVLDDKPRFRATHAVTGPSTRRRYKDFVKGDTLAGVVLDHPDNWDLVWDDRLNPWQTVIVQAPQRPEDWVIWLCQDAVDRLFRTQSPKRPTLLYVDEGLSFFGPTGIGRHGSAIQRCYRAGREKGMTSLLGSQRPKQINVQTLTEANRAYVFHLNSAGDTKHLVEQGGLEPPPRILGPAEKHRFWYYQDGLVMGSGLPFTLPRPPI